jgi:hypothetical protein
LFRQITTRHVFDDDIAGFFSDDGVEYRGDTRMVEPHGE